MIKLTKFIEKFNSGLGYSKLLAEILITSPWFNLILKISIFIVIFTFNSDPISLDTDSDVEDSNAGEGSSKESKVTESSQSNTAKSNITRESANKYVVSSSKEEERVEVSEDLFKIDYLERKLKQFTLLDKHEHSIFQTLEEQAKTNIGEESKATAEKYGNHIADGRAQDQLEKNQILKELQEIRNRLAPSDIGQSLKKRKPEDED